MSDQRNFEAETRDNAERKYFYDFDAVLRQYMIRSFSPFFTSGPALELGCYEGDLTTLLTPLFPDLTAVDVVESAIEVNRKRTGGQVKYVQGTIEQVELPPRAFDSIFLTHVLEHLEDPVAAMKRIRGWMSPRGRFYVAVPNANAPSRRIAVKMGMISHNTAVTPGEKAQGHLRTYTLDTLERDVRDAGLNVVHRGGVFFKALANFQFDRLMGTDIISKEYLEGCFQLGTLYPDLCASIFIVAETE